MGLSVLGMLMDTLNYPDQLIYLFPKSNLGSQHKFCFEWFVGARLVGLVAVLIHTWGNVEETFNPLGVSLGASFESRCCHLILNSSV
jgi:hypothetical protein